MASCGGGEGAWTGHLPTRALSMQMHALDFSRGFPPPPPPHLEKGLCRLEMIGVVELEPKQHEVVSALC